MFSVDGYMIIMYYQIIINNDPNAADGGSRKPPPNKEPSTMHPFIQRHANLLTLYSRIAKLLGWLLLLMAPLLVVLGITAAWVLLCIGLAHVMKRLIPIIEESKTLA